MIPNAFNDFVHVGSSFAEIKFPSPQSLIDYIIQIIDTVFNVDHVTGDEVIKTMVQIKDGIIWKQYFNEYQTSFSFRLTNSTISAEGTSCRALRFGFLAFSPSKCHSAN